MSIAKDSVDSSNLESETNVRRPHEVQFTTATEELLKTGCFYPNMPVQSEIDDVFLNNKDLAKDTEKEFCNKAYKTSGRLGAGVVLFWCVKHRECIGFTILQKAESCQIIYETLSTRFKEMPKYVIYDNACNLFEVASFINRSIAIIEIQISFRMYAFSVTVFILRITPTALAHSIASSILTCRVCLLSPTNRRMLFWINLKRLPHSCVGTYSAQSFWTKLRV